MSTMRQTILVVDDEEINLLMLDATLRQAGYQTLRAMNGNDAWIQIENHGDQLAAIVLDRVMPDQDGLTVLQQVKADPRFKLLPVIMQTCKTEKHEVLEGLQAGAFYYLAKPYDVVALITIVQSAIEDHERLIRLSSPAETYQQIANQMQQGEFFFRTLAQAQRLASHLTAFEGLSPDVTMGLTELLLNAVEHGNLGITYDEKTALNEQNTWHSEIERRLQLPQYRDKQAFVKVERMKDALRYTIVDQGNGFDWRKYIEPDPDRVFDNHGRGIMMAGMISFESLVYHGNGNRVVAVARLTTDTNTASE